MAKIYNENIQFNAVRSKIFLSLTAERQVPIFDVLKLSSGDNLPTQQMKVGEYDVYGGGGNTGKKHNAFNVSLKTLGIGRVGARCGCVFEVKPESWVTDNALFASEVDSNYDLGFLIHYLNFKKINELANTSAQPVISLKRMSGITIPFISIARQREILSIIQDVEKGDFDLENDQFSISEILKYTSLCEDISIEGNFQLILIKQLRQSFLREAMQGKLLGTHEASEENQETGQQLLEKIKAEKAQLIKDKKLKKEKELPPIKPEEIPFEIPGDWVWCRLGDLTLFSEAGKSFKCIEVPINEGEWGVIKVSAVSWDSFLENQNKLYSKTEPDDTTAKIENGDFLISRANTSELVGKSVVVKNISKNLLLSDKTIRFKFSSNVSSEFLNFCNNLKYARDYYAKMGTGSSPSMKNITRVHMNNLVIPLPPYSDQNFILKRIEQIQLICDQLEESIKQSQQQNEQLLQQVLREALEVKASDENTTNDVKQIIEKREEARIFKLPVLQPEEDFFYQKRKVLATYILNQSLSDPYLGDVKFMKLLHLADYHAVKRNLGQKFFQQAAGPYDNIFIHQYFKEVEGDNWFARVKKGERFHFSLGINHQESLKTYSYFTQDELNEVNKIIDLFKRDNYERPEIVSTLFAVWNNRIIRNEEISDELLMKDFLNWDTKKDKYRFRLKNELQWMRDKGIVPEGWGKVIEKSKNKRNAQAK